MTFTLLPDEQQNVSLCQLPRLFLFYFFFLHPIFIRLFLRKNDVPPPCYDGVTRPLAGKAGEHSFVHHEPRTRGRFPSSTTAAIGPVTRVTRDNCKSRGSGDRIVKKKT